jgi:hypothetical protein
MRARPFLHTTVGGEAIVRSASLRRTSAIQPYSERLAHFNTRKMQYCPPVTISSVDKEFLGMCGAIDPARPPGPAAGRLSARVEALDTRRDRTHSARQRADRRDYTPSFLPFTSLKFSQQG